jgi:multiple sugar transport system permease protein
MMRRRPRYSVFRLLALGLVLFWSGLPILLVVLASLKPSRDVFEFPPRFLFVPTFENYVALFQKWPAFLPALLNSLIIAAGSTLFTVLVCTFGGYAYARFRSRLLAASAFFMIFIRMLPPIIITLPLFPVVNALRLNDTHIVLIVLYSVFYVSLGTWVMKAFIDQIPVELDEAARIDGATVLQIIRRVIAPLAAHGIVAVSVFVFIFAWNEFIFAFIFASTRAKTGPLILSEILSGLEVVDWGVLFAAATIQVVPILIFTIAAQRFVVAGLTTGSVKG